MKRLVVAQADARYLVEMRAPLSCAVVRWSGAGSGPLAIALKLTMEFAHNQPDMVARVVTPEPPSLLLASELEDDGVAYPGDFMIAKERCDVLVHGHLHAAASSDHLDAAMRIGPLSLGLQANASAALSSIPIACAQIVSAGNLATRAKLIAPPAREGQDELWARFDRAASQCAPAAMQLDALAPDAAITLEGMSARYPRRQIALPGLVPVAFYETLALEIAPLPLLADTLWIDTDFERLCVVYRGLLPDGLADDELDRIIVALQSHDAPLSLDDVLALLPRGSFQHAVEEADLAGRPAPVADPSDLEIARFEALERQAEPELTLPAYVGMSAALAEQDRPRQEVLADSGFDERGWTVEDGAWLTRMQGGLDQGDATLAGDYADLFLQAQDALQKPHEPRPLEEYARAAVALDNSDEPAEALAALRLCMGEWMRLERHWQARAEEDDEVARELSVEMERARQQAAPSSKRARTPSDQDMA